MSNSNHLRVTRQDGIAIVTLNAPEKRNAITLAIAEDLARAVEELEADQAVSALVFTGAGSAFSAGGDLSDLLAARDGDAKRLKQIYSGFMRVAECRLPTLAAVNGPAVGAGLNLALACDIRLASATARFETRFLKLGIHSGGGHTWMLTRLVGPAVAAELLLLGRAVDGREAERIGLANKCVGENDVLAETITWAKATAAYDRNLVIASKDSLKRAAAATATHMDMLNHEFALQAESLRGPAFEKALAAFSARQKP